MGWAFCGTDSKGREIGYGIRATCDEPECSTEIDRGLGYACGGEHGESETACEGYFCGAHLSTVCRLCERAIRDAGEIMITELRLQFSNMQRLVDNYMNSVRASGFNPNFREASRVTSLGQSALDRLDNEITALRADLAESQRHDHDGWHAAGLAQAAEGRNELLREVCRCVIGATTVTAHQAALVRLEAILDDTGDVKEKPRSDSPTRARPPTIAPTPPPRPPLAPTAVDLNDERRNE